MKPALAILLLLLPLPAAAQNTDVSFFLGGARFETTRLVMAFPDDFGLDVELGFENGRVLSAGVNHFWSDRVSTDFSFLVLSTDPTLTVSGGGFGATFDIGDIRVGALTATGQWHFQREARLSPYVGGGVAVLRGEIESDFEDELEEVANVSADFETAVGLLVNAGVNLRINERWLFAVDVKFIPYSPEIDGEPPVEVPEEEIVLTDELDLNPVIVGVGLRYRF